MTLDVTTRRDAGSQVVTGIESIAVSEFTGTVGGLVKAEDQRPLVDPGRRPTPIPTTISARSTSTCWTCRPGRPGWSPRRSTASMPDLDMFVGTGSTPSLETEVCFSVTGGNLEHCDVPIRQARHLVGLDPELGGERRRHRHVQLGDRCRARRQPRQCRHRRPRGTGRRRRSLRRSLPLGPPGGRGGRHLVRHRRARQLAGFAG